MVIYMQICLLFTSLQPHLLNLALQFISLHQLHANFELFDINLFFNHFWQSVYTILQNISLAETIKFHMTVQLDIQKGHNSEKGVYVEGDYFEDYNSEEIFSKFR